MRHLIILIALFSINYSQAQSADGIAIDYLSGEPIPFVKEVISATCEGTISE